MKKQKSLIKRIVITTGVVITVLFLILIDVTVSLVVKSSQDTVDDDVNIMAGSYASYVSSWLNQNLNLMDFYCKSDVIHDFRNPEAVGKWLVTTVDRRSPELDYVLFLDKEGNSYYDSGKRGNNSDRNYFRSVMGGDDYFITDPTVAKATGRVSTMIVKAAYSSRHEKVGMFVGVKSVEKIQNEINSFTLGQKGYAFMLSGDGTAMSHPDSSIQMQKNFVKDSIEGHEDVGTIAGDMISGGRGNGVIKSFVEEGENDYVCYAPVAMTNWSVAIAVPESQINEASKTVRRIIVASSIGIGVIVLLLIIVLMVIAFKPLRVVVRSISDIASGNADLTRRIDVRKADEIGAVGTGFNAFVEKLHLIISQIMVSRNELRDVDENLQASILDTSTSISEILDNIDRLKEIFREQTASVDGTASAVTEIASNIQSLERMIQSQSSGVTQASAAIEQMIGNISAINSSIEKMAGEFSELQHKANLGSSKQQTVNEQISEIETQSTMLQEANVAISAIAEQTNLLAMNAAIEAAHAGDAGKGFAVVADEIRKLSETSSAQSKTIGEQLQKIRTSIETVVSSSSESSEAFIAVSGSIKETDELVRQIKAAMEEQAEGSKQVLDALHTMSDSTSNVRSASSEMNAGSEQILGEISRLKETSMNLNDSVVAINSSAVKIKETGNALSGISTQMNGSIRRIGEEIDQFKV